MSRSKKIAKCFIGNVLPLSGDLGKSSSPPNALLFMGIVGLFPPQKVTPSILYKSNPTSRL